MVGQWFTVLLKSPNEDFNFRREYEQFGQLEDIRPREKRVKVQKEAEVTPQKTRSGFKADGL